MGDVFSIWHWVIAALVWWLILGWPGVKILRRIGFSGWWIVLAFIPIVNFVAIWILATTRWPNLPERT